MKKDSLRRRAEALWRTVVEAPGVTPSAVRRAFLRTAAGEEDTLADPWARLLNSDPSDPATDPVARYRAAGLGASAVFELVVAAAAGAGQRRLKAGLAALEKAR